MNTIDRIDSYSSTFNATKSFSWQYIKRKLLAWFKKESFDTYCIKMTNGKLAIGSNYCVALDPNVGKLLPKPFIF